MLLIVDDTPENLAVIKDMLAPFGFEIIEAKDGYDAIEQMLEQKPDLIFMDLVMPGIDGFEATRSLAHL